MNQQTKHLLDTRLTGPALEQAIWQAKLSTKFAGVARSAGFGTATEQARGAKFKAREDGRRQRAARRRNR